ncbi:MAG: acyl carrier protein [Bacteroidales bacterium]|nr:acyl carrier protein [Bacteroidales bacterium]
MENRVLEIMRSVFQTESVDEMCSQQNCERWDSMNHLNLIVELEMEFGVSFEPEEIAQMRNFEEVMRIVKNKMA